MARKSLVFRDGDPIETLKLPPSIYSGLKNKDINTIGELCSHTEEEILLWTRNIGSQKLQDIKDTLVKGRRRLGEEITIGPAGNRIKWPANNRNRFEKRAMEWIERAKIIRHVLDYRRSSGKSDGFLQCARGLLELVGHVFIEIRENVLCHLIPVPVRKGKEQWWIMRFEPDGFYHPNCCSLCGGDHRSERCTTLNEPRVLSAEDVAEMKKKYEEYEE